MDVSPLLEGLNAAQREAVCAPLSHRLILAGAGAGKTRVPAHRIGWLCATEGFRPSQVLAVTFTNKAAREMQQRIRALLAEVEPGYGAAQGMWVGTFHGLAHRLLRLHWRDAGLVESFQILDADDQNRLLKRIVQDLELDESRFPPRQAAWWINGHKDEGRRAKHIQPTDPITRTWLRIYEAYEATCERSGLVDFA